MVKIFTRKEIKRLGKSDSDADLILDYQKKIPILTENEGTEGFCVNSRDLYDQLGVKKQYADWIKSRMKSYEFISGVDYIMVSPNSEIKGFATGGDTRSVNYICTIAMAENLALVEKTELGKLTRKYFRLMRDIVKDNAEWWATRKPQKENYRPMCEALSSSIYKATGRLADDWDYKYEANRLNIIATGSSAQTIKLYLGMQPNELTRDGLETDYNEKIAFLQEQNLLLLGMNMPIIERLKMLITMFNIKYPTASPILSYMSRDDLLKARNDMIEELENR